jgi:hypothetical protein
MRRAARQMHQCPDDRPLHDAVQVLADPVHELDLALAVRSPADGAICLSIALFADRAVGQCADDLRIELL